MKRHSVLLKKLCIYGLAAMNLTVSALPVAAQTEEIPQLESEVTVVDNTAQKAQTAKEKNTFEDVNTEIVFVKEALAKDAPDESGDVVGSFNKGDEAVLIGMNDYADWKIEMDGEVFYVNRHTFEEKQEEDPAAYEWTGPVLTKSAGVNQGPTGKETYYNLPMEGVISIMRGMGNTDEYWVREDGVKMLGDYVIVAANLSMFPRGSLVPCSLGMAIVCDTGGFAASNPTQLDIATAW